MSNFKTVQQILRQNIDKLNLELKYKTIQKNTPRIQEGALSQIVNAVQQLEPNDNLRQAAETLVGALGTEKLIQLLPGNQPFTINLPDKTDLQGVVTALKNGTLTLQNVLDVVGNHVVITNTNCTFGDNLQNPFTDNKIQETVQLNDITVNLLKPGEIITDFTSFDSCPLPLI